MKLVQSWGRLEAEPHQVVLLTSPQQTKTAVKENIPGLAFGNGRSYGDICLNPNGFLWNTQGLNNLCSWNPETGRLTSEAGVLLKDVQQTFLSRGWMLPVTPGTQLVTIGGAIANDVHGKNHHAFGTFGDHIIRLWLLRTNGQEIECSRDINIEWFEATIGGMGLTGVILKAEIQLKPVSGPWLESETIPFQGLEEFFSLSDSSEPKWEHTVSWIDCLAGINTRGIFMRANPSKYKKTEKSASSPIKINFTPPISPINKLTLNIFNSAYYWLQRARSGKSIVNYTDFFYPLDGILEWNRLYGPNGFFQYQSVIPRETGLDATREMLREISRAGEGSFLAVLKTFGNRPSSGLLSFARPGVTLALDFPNRNLKTLALFNRLDRIVEQAGGALYLAKDKRMSERMFIKTYPNLEKFLPFRDPGITSSMSRRLFGS